jgi:lactoylglutathione lyase
MITNVHIVGVFVKDQEKALDFYSNVLGFEVLTNEPMGPDARWIEVAPPGGQTRLALYTPPGAEDRIGNSGSIVFKCKDIYATYEELQQRGVKFTQVPTDQPGGVMAEFVDPDGNEFVLSG